MRGPVHRAGLILALPNELVGQPTERPQLSEHTGAADTALGFLIILPASHSQSPSPLSAGQHRGEQLTGPEGMH